MFSGLIAGHSWAEEIGKKNPNRKFSFSNHIIRALVRADCLIVFNLYEFSIVLEFSDEILEETEEEICRRWTSRIKEGLKFVN